MFKHLQRLFRTDTKAMTAAADMPWLAAGVTTASGFVVSIDTALRVPAVACAVRALSEAAMTLPAKVVRVDSGSTVDVPDHPVARLIADGVNDWTDWPTFVRDMVAQSLCRDAGGVAWCNRIGGELREVIHYRPGVIAVDTSAETGEPTYRIGGRVLDSADVVHLAPPLGLAPLTRAREAIGVAAMMEHHAARLFGNGAKPSGLLKFPNKLGAETAARIAKSWNDSHGGDRSGRTAVLEEGADFLPMTFTSTDAQFLELRTFQIDEIARAFRVPPGMLYEMTRQTWSNMEQAGREFLVYSLEPHLLALEGALRRALFSAEERRTHRIVFDRDDLTRADLGERATAYSSLISSRVINPNEARAWEGLPPYAEGDAFLNPAITPAAPAEAQS